MERLLPLLEKGKRGDLYLRALDLSMTLATTPTLGEALLANLDKVPDWKDEVLEVLGEVRREGSAEAHVLAELEHLRTGIEPESEERLRELLQDAEENGGTATTLRRSFVPSKKRASQESMTERGKLCCWRSRMTGTLWDSTSWKKRRLRSVEARLSPC